jgi:hypothetical protein
MPQPTSARSYPIEEALRAQQALRAAAGLSRELFRIPAFVGMVSDEIEALRKLGRTDEQIAHIVCQSSAIEVTAAEIAVNYASPVERHPI